MHWWYSKNGEVVGPVTPADMESLIDLGILLPTTQVYGKQDGGLEVDWRPLSATSLIDLLPEYAVSSQSGVLRKIADHERISGAFWMALGVIQCLFVVSATAGIWNIIGALSRFKLSKRILNGDPDVPSEFDGVSGLIVTGIVNIFLGGGIGIVLVAFDFLIRDRVLSNNQSFNNARHHASGTSPTEVAKLTKPKTEPLSSPSDGSIEWLFTAPDGNIYGPIPTDAIRAAYARGDLTLDAKVRRWPNGAWGPISESEIALPDTR